MARFDVYRSLGDGPIMLDCQANLYQHFATRFVVPLLPVGGVPAPIRRMHPVFEIDGSEWIMATHLAAAVPVRALGKVVVSLAGSDYAITNALDTLMSGF